MLSFQIYTMYLNTPSLLNHAIDSLGEWRDQVVVLDNSNHQDLSLTGFEGEIFRPQVPLSCAQSYNLILSLAVERQQKYFFIMHSDAECTPEVVEQMIQRGEDLSHNGTRWGVLFSHYDVLCLHNTSTLKDFRWDQNLPVYFTDVDFYRRLRLAGIQTVDSEFDVGHMNDGSNSMKQDPVVDFYVRTNFPAWHHYYVGKWGGSRDQETFSTPFNSGDVRLLMG